MPSDDLQTSSPKLTILPRGLAVAFIATVGLLFLVGRVSGVTLFHGSTPDSVSLLPDGRLQPMRPPGASYTIMLPAGWLLRQKATDSGEQDEWFDPTRDDSTVTIARANVPKATARPDPRTLAPRGASTYPSGAWDATFQAYHGHTIVAGYIYLTHHGARPTGSIVITAKMPDKRVFLILRALSSFKLERLAGSAVSTT